MAIDTGDLRVDYQLDELLESSVSSNPIEQFEEWFKVACASSTPEPNAMVIATADAAGNPSARVVLLKEVNAQGFVFFTNYDSRKGKELAARPKAALVFNWLELQRQVRIEGRVEKLSEDDSTTYFQSRPKGSQIGAWASPQSEIIPDRNILEDKKTALEQSYAETAALPKPANWGGFLVVPQRIEFWQGRSSRLHDRLLYEAQEDGSWQLLRLAP